MNFLKSFLAAFVALIVFSVIVFFLVIGWIGSIASEKQVVVKDNSVLHLRLDARITELQRENPFEGLPIPVREDNMGLMQLKQVIKHAATDEKVKGIFLEAGNPGGGFSVVEEIREALLDFRKSGKWVVAYNENMSEKAYYLATAADEVYLNPHGEIEFNGLTLSTVFFKRLFDKLEIKPQIFRVGEYKSAIEPFILDRMSRENELQLSELANSMYDYILARIAEARKIPQGKLKEISDKMLVQNASLAKEHGLVDDLLYEEDFLNNLRTRLGIGKSDEINFVKYGKYRKSFSTYKSSKNEIAVIVAEGTIVPPDAEDQQDVVNAESFIKEIRKAKEDNGVKAIVVRINSPGGEVTASDMMWKEIQSAAKVKPVIASLSDVAASGGYYMAMACDTIVAQPHTITGSIGVFGMIFDMSGFLGNKLGITFDEVRTGEFGQIYTVTRPLTDVEKRIVQRKVEDIYETFTRKAAESRSVSVDEIKQVASGRVWTGTQAKTRKLIDIEGGFDDAVNIAAAKAGVKDDFKIRFYPKVKSFFEQWLAGREETEMRALKLKLGESYAWYEHLQRLKTYQGVQARMPFEITFH